MIFLTSSPTGPLDGSYQVLGMDEANSFRENLKKRWTYGPVLMITAFPDDAGANAQMRSFFAHALADSGLPCSRFDLWDRAFPSLSKDALSEYTAIFLGGGHVPTQHAFFEEIGLREKLVNVPGILIGISAGSMNAATTVYAQPELPGESTDPAYLRHFPGLNLTKTNILPHYQMVKDHWLDGKRLFEDITYPDSHGHRFLVLTDGSYLLIENGTETVYGLAYSLSDGQLVKICSEGQCAPWAAC